jgi:hypothetical protein
MDLKGRCPISNNENNNNISNLSSRFESVFFKGCSFNRTAILSERKFFNYTLVPFKQTNIKINLNVTSIQYCVDSCLYMYQFIAFNHILNDCICLKYLEKGLEINLVNKNDCLLTTNENLTQMYEIYSTGSIGDTKCRFFKEKNLFL